MKISDDSPSVTSEYINENTNHLKEQSLGNMEPPTVGQPPQRNSQTNASIANGTNSPAGAQTAARSTTPGVDNKPSTPPMKKKKANP